MSEAGNYLRLFVGEASDHAETFGRLWPLLLGTVFAGDVVDELFRHTHSIRGMAATMGFEEIVALSGGLEQLLSELRSRRVCLTEQARPSLLRASELLTEMIRRRADEKKPDPDWRLPELLAEIAQLRIA